ncbi:MAG: hypothetical protein ACUVX8_05355, partial [Candidatus Zipacnadales bacterium]
GGVTVSRLIVGGNPFSGNSHWSVERSREMRDYYTVERIKATLRQCEREGITTLLARADNHIMRMLVEYWNEGGTVQFIAQSCPEHASVTGNIDAVAALGGRMCYLHGGHADRLVRTGELDFIRQVIEHGKSKGLVMGVGGHRPETHEVLVEAGVGAEFHCCSFYNLTDRYEEYVAEDRERMIATIRQLPVPVIGYKIMAAGRNDPEEAFAYAFANLRPNDAVCVGVFPKYQPDEVAQDAALTRKYGANTSG